MTTGTADRRVVPNPLRPGSGGLGWGPGRSGVNDRQFEGQDGADVELFNL
jgi:hypothetical protein